MNIAELLGDYVRHLYTSTKRSSMPSHGFEYEFFRFVHFSVQVNNKLELDRRNWANEDAEMRATELVVLCARIISYDHSRNIEKI